MVTIKLKKPAPSGQAPAPKRSPVRGSGSGVKKNRPTLAEAQRQRAERDAQHPEQRPGPRPAADRRSPARPAPAAAGRGGGPRAQPEAAPQPTALRRPFDRGLPGRGSPDRALPDQRLSDRGPPNRGPFDRGPFDRAQFDRPPSDRGPSDRTAPDRATTNRPISNRPAPNRAPPTRTFPERSRPRSQVDDDDDDFHPHAEHPPGSMRLSKRMSELGIASRREADEWIAKGWVRVDDQVVSALGSRVMPGQRVTIDARAKYLQAQKVTVLVNKPVGFVSGQAEDGYEPTVVLVTPANQWSEDHSGTRFLREHTKNLVPAGRLDIDSVGLLVLTQDGRVAKQLIGEDSDIEKEYLVRVATTSSGPGGPAGPDAFAASDLELLRHGLELDGEALRPATVEWVNADQLRFVLRQGKKRQIRRMCEAVGLQVLGLKRVRIGQVMLGDLPAGQWRYLRREEGF